MSRSDKVLYYLLRRIFKYSSPFTRPLKNSLINSYASEPEAAQPLFILGVPRSGTTITYQVISNYFNVLYPDNLVYLCRENPFLGFDLSNRIFGDKPHNCFSSKQGNTLECGLHAPSQEPVFWKKYIHKLHKRLHNTEILDDEEKKRIYINLFSVINKFKKPMVMKGAAVGNNLKVFLEIFPNAKFIQFTREPLYTAQSLFITTKKMGIDFEDVWMKRIKPYNYQTIFEEPSLYKKIALYIYALYKQNTEDLKYIPRENYISFSYEELCSSMNMVLGKVDGLLGGHERNRENVTMPSLKNNNNQKLSDSDFCKLSKEINSLNWQNII
ncbi:MAG: sulfotransferase [Candidatus Woesearchaeota archaeon]